MCSCSLEITVNVHILLEIWSFSLEPGIASRKASYQEEINILQGLQFGKYSTGRKPACEGIQFPFIQFNLMDWHFLIQDQPKSAAMNRTCKDSFGAFLWKIRNIKWETGKRKAITRVNEQG